MQGCFSLCLSFSEKKCVFHYFAAGKSPGLHLTELLVLVLCLMKNEQAINLTAPETPFKN